MSGVVAVCAAELGMLGTERLVAIEVRAEAGMGSMDFLRPVRGGKRRGHTRTHRCWMPRMTLALSRRGRCTSESSPAMSSASVAVDAVSGRERRWEAANAAAGESGSENFRVAIGFGRSSTGGTIFSTGPI